MAKKSLFQTIKTRDGHRATIHKEATPKLLTPHMYHIAVYCKEKPKTKLYSHSVCMPELAIKIAEDWKKPEPRKIAGL